MGESRKKEISIYYNGVNASKEISKYLESFTYTDSAEESDMISITLNDRDKRWIKDWIPVKGDKIKAEIILHNWNYEGEKVTYNCGDFLVDDFIIIGPITKCVINAVSAPVETDFKERKNTKTWENATINIIAAEIAEKYKLELVYDSNTINIKRIEQNEQTDAEFIKALCTKYGLGIKAYSHKLIIWDYEKYTKKDTVLEIVPIMSTKWTYKSTMQGTYTGAKIAYTNPSTKENINIMVGTEGRICTINEKVDNENDAKIIGESAIRKANRKENVISMTLIPSQFVSATSNVRLKEFGYIDGKYAVNKVTHNLNNNYSVQYQLEKIEEVSAGSATAEEEKANGEIYIVKKGDTLWGISKKYYGTPTKYPEIYEANKQIIESTARQHGKNNSSNGHWIWPGTNLIIPGG